MMKPCSLQHKHTCLVEPNAHCMVLAGLHGSKSRGLAILRSCGEGTSPDRRCMDLLRCT